MSELGTMLFWGNVWDCREVAVSSIKESASKFAVGLRRLCSGLCTVNARGWSHRAVMSGSPENKNPCILQNLGQNPVCDRKSASSSSSCSGSSSSAARSWQRFGGEASRASVSLRLASKLRVECTGSPNNSWSNSSALLFFNTSPTYALEPQLAMSELVAIPTCVGA